MKRLFGAACALWLATAATAQVPAHDHAAHAPAAASAAVALTEGLVRKIDRDAAQLTLRHGPITNLNMGAMTMVFKVADRAWLTDLKEGDQIRFAASRINGVITITAIERAAPQ